MCSITLGLCIALKNKQKVNKVIPGPSEGANLKTEELPQHSTDMNAGDDEGKTPRVRHLEKKKPPMNPKPIKSNEKPEEEIEVVYQANRPPPKFKNADLAGMKTMSPSRDVSPGGNKNNS